MSTIPVIVGFGGVNAAGRSSGHHGYRRTVVDRLGPERAGAMWRSLAGLVGRPGDSLDAAAIEHLAAHSLVRGLESHACEPGRTPWNRWVRLANTNGPARFALARRDLPQHLPEGWRIEETEGDRVRVVITEGIEVLVPDRREIGVGAAGQVPEGFDPGITTRRATIRGRSSSPSSAPPTRWAAWGSSGRRSSTGSLPIGSRPTPAAP